MTDEVRRLRRKARGYRIFAVLFAVISVGCLLVGIAGCVVGDPWVMFVCFVTWVVLAGLYAWMGDQAADEAARVSWRPAILDQIAQARAELEKWRDES